MKKTPPPTAPSAQAGLEALTDLAMDLRWSWNHSADALWKRLDPELWELTHLPSVVLQTIAQDKLNRALGDAEFRQQLDQLVAAKREALTAPAWFQKKHPGADLTCVAYFCMEFMLSEALPIYSGGLGNVAGDQLKAASDLGVPVVGIGLLYQRGYFHQMIGHQGAQQALYPYNDPSQLPVTPVRKEDGEWLRVKVAFPSGDIWLRAWKVQVGRSTLYLLDSNDAVNLPKNRGITGELYGGDQELRLKQEIVLGIGGWRLLEALDIHPEVCHLNEGHAAFALLERARSFTQKQGVSFATALMATRAGNLFTSHTAVAAGFDLFEPELIERYLGRYAEAELGISAKELLALGRLNPDDAEAPFNMAYLATRGSGAVNAVSRLHGQVSRRIFSPLFPNWPLDEVPVGHVTNGVHMPTWDSKSADALWTQACGKARWLGTSDTLEDDLRRVSDQELWTLRANCRKCLVDYARGTVGRQLTSVTAAPSLIAQTQARLDPEVLTLGFARRFATYKRPNLLLHDPERLLRILKNPQRRVQLILAGKAHPADQAGMDLIQEWSRFIAREDLNPPVVFLADYDMLMAEHLVQGIDVWINTPRRPWEASGTSGMKVLVNGGLNLSVLDGWWAEAYQPNVGWALGDGKEHGGDPEWDAEEAEALYALLENEVIPEFYTRNDEGIPAAWVERMRESMAHLTPQFASSRTVTDYTEKHYLPAAEAYRTRSRDQAALANKLVDQKTEWLKKRSAIRFESRKVQNEGNQHIIEVEVFLGDANPDTVWVELYADGVNGGVAVIYEMKRTRTLSGVAGGYAYLTSVSADRPATDYTARIRSHIEGLAAPLETSWILWQK